MSVAYYELTLTSTSKEELEKIQYWLIRTPAGKKVDNGRIEERCEHGIEWVSGDCSDCPEGEGKI